MKNSKLFIALSLLVVNTAFAEDTAAKMKATLNVATDKEPAQVAEIRQYYTQIKKQAQKSEVWTYSDIASNFHTVLYDNEKEIFRTIESPEEREYKFYSEFLFDKKTGKLVFAYQNSSYEDERGKQNPQLRYYWHNGKLIHSKMNKNADLETTCDDLLKEANYFRENGGKDTFFGDLKDF